MLKDVQLAAEREKAVVCKRMRQYKEKKEAMMELNAGKEVEQMLKSEATAWGHMEENEEALQESTPAFENARAEIQVLRTELAVNNNFLYDIFANPMI